MISLKEEQRIHLRNIDNHLFICDLLYLEGPILSLYRDNKNNWLYLWCDTDKDKRERWLLFPASRTDLIDYLEDNVTLLSLIKEARIHYTLDQIYTKGQGSPEGLSFRRILRQLQTIDIIKEYLPEEDSFFDPELSPDISLAKEVSPSQFDISIDGDWFFSDLDKFSRAYSQLYAFFYCTKPRFITNLGERVERYLKSPWKGGFSRVHLFEALSKFIPSLHDLEIKEIQYASPGSFQIEALESVGMRIAHIVNIYIENKEDVSNSAKKINQLLTSAKLKRKDLSSFKNDQLPLRAENIDFLEEHIQNISLKLSISEEIDRLTKYSPNIVVVAKVLLALIERTRKLSNFQINEQIRFYKA